MAGPSSAAVQADVDAFLRGAGPGFAPAAPEFQEFEAIYGQPGNRGMGWAAGPGVVPAPPGAAAAAGRVQLGHFLQVNHPAGPPPSPPDHFLP